MENFLFHMLQHIPLLSGSTIIDGQFQKEAKTLNSVVFWDVTQRRLSLKMGPIRSFDTSVRNQPTLRNIIIIIIIIITYLLTYLLKLGFDPVAVVLHQYRQK